MSDFAAPPTIVEGAEDLTERQFEHLLANPTHTNEDLSARSRVLGAVVGTLVGFREDGMTPLVTYPGQPGTAALSARATVHLLREDIGQSAVLMFETGDPGRPIVVGRLAEAGGGLPRLPEHVSVDLDGECLVVSAKEQIVLRCGSASITLTKAGKILISGEYVSSRSSGVNRVQGGSVQLN